MRASRCFLLLFVGALLALAGWPAPGLAQPVLQNGLDELDPGARDTIDESDDAPEPLAPPAPKPAPPDAGPARAQGPKAGGKAIASADSGVPDGGVAAAPALQLILLSQASDSDLDAAWERWRKANADQNLAAAGEARTELSRLREDLALGSLDEFSVGLVRAAEARQRANDASGAIELASAAVELSPKLPHAHLGLADAYFFGDSTQIGRVLGELTAAARCMADDPRYLRPVVADVGAGLLLALAATAGVVALALFARRVRYFLHDFHHVFPKAAAHWQSAAAAVLLLSVPVVMRLGVVVVLATLLAATALYLSRAERAVAAVLLASLGLLPVGASSLARHSAFAGTLAEDVAELDRGGHGAGEALARIERRALEERAGYAELLALGRYQLSRGGLEPALAHIQAAIVKRAGDPRALVNLGNALAVKGDLEGAAVVYQSAFKTEPSLAAAQYNLGRVLEARAESLPVAEAVLERDRARDALSQARRLDPSLEARPDPKGPTPLNRLLLSPGLAASEIAALVDAGAAPEKVQSQVALQLLGEVEWPWAAGLPPLLALAVLFLGSLRLRIGAAKVCNKCGRPVCRRCDPELGRGSEMCHQCINVFARKGVVPPPVKVRKQAEVERYHNRMDKLAVAIGVFCSGAGHLFAGLPVRGAIYAFLFLFVVVMAVLRDGVVRPLYGDPVFLVRVGALALLFLLVYFLPLRGLYKRQSE